MAVSYSNRVYKQYSWGDMKISVAGNITKGVVGISYGASKQKFIYAGKNGKPQKVLSSGIKDYRGSITVLHSTFEYLQSISPTSDVLDISNFSIIVVYELLELKVGGYTGVSRSAGIKDIGGNLTTEVIEGCSISGFNVGYSQGQRFSSITLPFIYTNLNKVY